MAWSHELQSLGVPWLDAEHLQLAAVIEQLTRCIREESPAAVQDGFTRLLDLAREHFHREEQYMSRYGYPSIREHEKAHERSIWYIEMLSRDLKEGAVVLDAALIDDLWDWNNAHITCEDRAFSDYLKVVEAR